MYTLPFISVTMSEEIRKRRVTINERWSSTLPSYAILWSIFAKAVADNARHFSTTSDTISPLDHHHKAANYISASVRQFYNRKERYRIIHGSTNSTRLSAGKRNNLVDISGLSHVLEVNTETRTALVEPNVPMDRLVEETMKYGWISRWLWISRDHCWSWLCRDRWRKQLFQAWVFRSYHQRVSRWYFPMAMQPIAQTIRDLICFVTQQEQLELWVLPPSSKFNFNKRRSTLRWHIIL